MKIGDKVRFLSEVGGGIVTGFQGKDFVLVEDADGFDIPMPVRECVVIDADDYNIKRKPVAQKDVPDAAKSKGAAQFPNSAHANYDLRHKDKQMKAYSYCH